MLSHIMCGSINFNIKKGENKNAEQYSKNTFTGSA